MDECRDAWLDAADDALDVRLLRRVKDANREIELIVSSTATPDGTSAASDITDVEGDDSPDATSLDAVEAHPTKPHEAPNLIMEEYETLCPGAFDDADDAGPSFSFKRRKKGGSTFDSIRSKGSRKGPAYVPVSPGSRKRKPKVPRKRKPPVYNREEWKEFDPKSLPQRKMRDLISLFYLTVLHAPPPEDWHGDCGTVSEICTTLKLKKSQRLRVENVIAETHRALLLGEEYDSSRAHRPGTRAIKDGSVEQQMVADCRERGMSYTETTLFINRDCEKKVVRPFDAPQSSRVRITWSARYRISKSVRRVIWTQMATGRSAATVGSPNCLSVLGRSRM